MDNSIRDLPGRPQAIATAMGIASPTSRDLDIARRVLSAGESDVPGVADLLGAFRQEDETAETARVDLVRQNRARTVEAWTEFAAARSKDAAPPEGVRVVHIRDELTRELVRLHLPIEFFAD